MTDRETLEKYVDAGISLLDKKGPKGWIDKIDTSPGAFDISHYGSCILAQVYGDFELGWGELLPYELSLDKWGFAASTCHEEYHLLNQIWKEKLNQ